MIRIIFIIALFPLLRAQKIDIINQEKKDVSFRGLSIVSDSTLWLSGSKGTIGRSLDAGKTFEWVSPKGYETVDFRDIEAFNDSSAVVMGITEPGILLKTTDGGKNWREIFRDETKGVFFDAIDFVSENRGILLGDPLDEYPYIRFSEDIDDQWSELPIDLKEFFLPTIEKDEFFFAASGSNIIALNHNHLLIVTGGSQSRLIVIQENPFYEKIPIIQGNETSGANAIDYNFEHNFGIIVGGDYMQPDSTIQNVAVFSINFDTEEIFFSPIFKTPSGYRSSVAILDKKKAITCGINGVDFSIDQGLHWETISNESFHVCEKARKGTTVFLAGKEGTIGKLIH